VSITSQAELDALRAIGRIVRKALDAMAAAVHPGVTTAELDQLGVRVLAENGAESAPPKVHGFPGTVCISVNDEAVHGTPGQRVLCPGDLVKLDLVAGKDGFLAEAAITVGASAISTTAASLVRCAERAFQQAAEAARVGYRLDDIGRAVEREAVRCRFHVMRAWRPWRRKDHPRTPYRPQLPRSRMPAVAHGRPGHHH
jgi:methionyl aminopeptidase